MAVDANGNTYVVGFSLAGWGSPVRPYSSNLDTFVARFSLDTIWRQRHAAGDFDGDGADELVADFEAAGLRLWNDAAGSRVSPSNPE